MEARKAEVLKRWKVKGAKNDEQEGKQVWIDLPLALLGPLADAFRAGTKKYWRFSCLEHFDDPNERFYDAQLRHVDACQIDPLAIDPETGCYHQAQVAFNALMRLHHCLKEKKGA